MSEEEGRCRFGWHPKLLAFFITAALGLSVMSSLDCKFLAIELGFVPQSYYNDELGAGLWSYAAPDGRCMSYGESQDAGGFTDGDTLYSDVFINGDTNWTISRVFALVGIIFGLIAFVSVAINVCKSEPHLVDLLAYTTITAFLCECAKLGIFMGVDMCKSNEYWYNEEKNEYSGSVGCQIGRGAFMSIASLASYFVSMVLAVGYAARPKIDTYDEASLPSWMASENESSAKAHAPSQKEDRRQSMDRQSSQYDWSRSAPSTIPSQQAVEENYAIDKDSSDEQEERERDEFIPAPIRPYRPKTTVPKKFDDVSTLTWDPGY